MKTVAEEPVESSEEDAGVKALKTEAAELQNKLRSKEESFAMKLDAERRNLSIEKQFFESESSRLKDDFSRRLKLHAHAFATFLDTLPQNHAAAGYGMLQSIINEWDGDLASVQERAKRFAAKPREEQESKADSSPGQEATQKWSWLPLAGAALAGIGVVLIALAIALSAWLFWRQGKDIPQQTGGISSTNDISRLAGVRLDTQEDLAKAYDILKPCATADEIIFLNARSQAIMSSKTGDLK